MNPKQQHEYVLRTTASKLCFGLILAIFTPIFGLVSQVHAEDGNPPELHITSEPPSFVEYCQLNDGSLDFELYAITDEDASALLLDYEYNGDMHSADPSSVDGDTAYFSVSILCSSLDPHTHEDIFFSVTDSDGTTHLSRTIEMGAAGDDTVPVVIFVDTPDSFISNCEEDYGSLFFAFDVYDNDNLDDIHVELEYNGVGHGVDPTYRDYSNGYSFYEYTAYCDEFEPGETVTFTASASDNDGTGTESIEIEFEGEIVEDSDAPVITFTTVPGLKQGTFWVEGYVDDYDDVSNIDYIDWWVDGGDNFGIAPVDGSFDSPNEEFRFEVFGLSSGLHQITVRAFDVRGNSSENTLDVQVDGVAPVCTGWTNLSNPVYSNELTYTGITCTDDVEITGARHRIYHYYYGDVYGEVQVLPVDGSFDSDTEEFSFTITLPDSPNQDGPMSVYFEVFDAAGNSSYDEDPIVVDYEDQTPPVVNLTAVTPDPLADTTPTITGSCVDNTFRETNSNIASISVSVDGGSSESISPLDGEFDSRSEHFTYTTEELALGEHQIEVTCTDTAGNSGFASEEFEIAIQDADAEPGAFDYEEQFENNEYQDVPNTTLIWGNGRLRLREDITIGRTPIDTDNFKTRYAVDYNDYVVVPGVETDTLWYSKNDTVARYNIATEEITYLDHSAYGVSNFGTVNNMQEFTYEGANYLAVTSDHAVFLLNITDTIGVQVHDHGGTLNVVPDVDRGRFGMYLVMSHVASGNTSLAYWDLNDTLEDTSDDIWTIFPEGASAFDGTSVVGLVKGYESDELYIGIYDKGLYRLNDNNTPSNFADDQAAHYNYIDVFNGITSDPEGRLIFGTANVDNGEVFVVLDDGGTPYDSSDDTVQKIANARQVGYKDIFGLTYVEGQNDVGDQIIIKTENANAVYFNFNSTYENLNDDTFIELETDGGVRPSVSNVYVYDYNTLYVVVDTQGLYKVQLNRGWADSGQAVGLPPRPPQTLLVNNFTAGATLLDPLLTQSEAKDSWLSQAVPQVYAAGEEGITYEVSVDDGVTWQVVTLGELQQLAENDYRLQFRIRMEEQDGASPALSSYSLNFGGYVNEDQMNEVEKFGVHVSPTSSEINSDFTVTVEAQDILGHRVDDYSGVVNVQLVTSDDQDAQAAFNVTQVTLLNGVGSIGSARVSETGNFKVSASADGMSGQSSTFTITDAVSPPTPTMSFVSNNYHPNKGQTFTLSWSTTHLTSLTLNPGNHTVDPTDSRDFAISNDTTYTLSGSGPYGSLSSTITIEVGDDAGPTPTPSPTATPSPSPSVSPSSSPAPDSSPNPKSSPAPESSPNPESTASVSPAPSSSQRWQSSGNEEVDDQESSGDDSSSGGILDFLRGEQLSSTELRLDISAEDIVVIKGEKVQISWDTANADAVIIDYFGKEMAFKGSFEFYPTRTQEIKIIARKGDQTIERVITVTVKELPGILGIIVPPVFAPFVSSTLKWGASMWLALITLLLLLGFNKRRPRKQAEMSVWQRVGFALSTFLWIISPVVTLIAIIAAAFFTTPWLILVALLCVIVFVRRVHQWLNPQTSD